LTLLAYKPAFCASFQNSRLYQPGKLFFLLLAFSKHADSSASEPKTLEILGANQILSKQLLILLSAMNSTFDFTYSI
jgi:hypothetical protein